MKKKTTLITLTARGKNAVAKVKHLHNNMGKSLDAIVFAGVSTCVIEYALCTPSADTYKSLIKYGYAHKS